MKQWNKLLIPDSSLCSTALNPFDSHLWVIGILIITVLLLLGTIAVWRRQTQRKFTQMQQIQAALQQANAELQQEIHDRTFPSRAVDRQDCPIGKIAEPRTDYHPLEGDLQPNHRFLKTVIDHLPVAIFVKDGRAEHFGKLRLWNQTSVQMFGLTAAQALGKTIYDYFPPEQADFFAQKDREAFAKGVPEDIPEEPIDSYSLGRRILHTIKVPLYTEDQQPEYLLCFSEDITDRKQTEAALRDSEERLRLALMAANQGLYDLNLQTGNAIVNPEYATMLGYEPAEFHETNAQWIERLHPEDTEKVAGTYQAYVRGDLADYRVEFRQRTKTGDWKWILSLGKIVAWDESGQPLRMLGTHTDISDRKQAELERSHLLVEAIAARSEATAARDLLTNVFARMNDGIVALDTNWCYTYVNHKASEFLARSAADLIGKHIWTEFPDSIDRPSYTAYYQAVEQQRPIYLQEYYPLGDRWFENRIYPSPDGLTIYFTEITDRKQAEAALRASEEKYRHLIDNLHSAVVVHAPDTGILLSNATASKLLGLTPDQLLGRTVLDPSWSFVREDGSPLPLQEYPVNQVLATGNLLKNCILGINHPIAASCIWVLVNAFPEVNADRQIQQIVVTFVDITESKRAEETLRQERNLLSRIMETSPAGVVVLNPEGEITFANVRAEQILGLSRNEVIGRTYKAPDWQIQSVDGSPFPEEELPFVQIMRTGKPVSDVQHAIQWPNGQRVVLSINGAPAFNAAGQIDQVVVTIENITDRNQAETALRESEHRYAQILDSVQDMVFCKAPNSVVIYANQATCNYYNLTAEQLRGITDVPSNEIDYTQQYLRDDRQVFATGQTIEVLEEPNQGADGEVHYFHTIKSPIFDTEGKVVQIVGVSRDITERQQVAEALRVRAKQQAAVAQLGQVALAGMDLSILMNTTTVLVAESLRVEYCQVLELLPDGQGLLLRAGVGWQPGLVGHAIVARDANSLAGYTLLSHEPVLVEDLRTDPRFNSSPLLQDHQVVSGISLMIQGDEQPFGVLEAYFTQPRHFSQDDVNFLQAVANILATAIGRKRAEAARQESEARFRQLAENIQEVFWMADAAFTQVLYVSPAYEVIWGRPCASLYERIASFAEAIDPHDRDHVRSVARQPQGWDLEYRIVQPDGTQRWIWEQAFPVSDHTGQIHRVVGICQDITDRKQAELQIQQLNRALEAQNANLEFLVARRTAELETFFEALPDYVYVYEGRDLRFTFCNDRYAQFLGFENRHQLQGKTLFDCSRLENAAELVQQNHHIMNTGETVRTEETWDLPIGTRYFDTIKVALRQANGEIYGLLGVTRDITELVEVRQALAERTVQLETTNQELESFSYSVSHDLRAPLRHMHGFVNALQERLADHQALTDLKVTHYLQVIENSSQKMALLIDGLLTLSRIGRRPIAWATVNLRELIDEAIALITSEVNSHHPAEFIIHDLSPVQGDAALLQQVFYNLLDNAVKFSRNVPHPQIEIGSLPDQTLFIKDNGAGFQMAYADKLFGAFQRLHSQQEFAGTGIGLAIVHRIILRHGGRVWAEGNPGQGATFYFKLGQTLELK